MKMVSLTAVQIVVALFVLAASPSVAKDPDCARTNGWVTNMAFAHLKNAGITSNERIDLTKTRITRMASQRIGKDLYRQVHRITFTERTGNTIDVIAVNDASSQECSMSGVEVYVITKHLGP